eukprot:TRINITY_DN19686_c0_g1_i1.p1 TRINITY_DN19686_c0_g1~~TRINITY_DN19686_c0_g1_i1.p1  ORF type:complete len:463 (+),score=86.36 TRINITY_DN19686_c0_g1_i1:1-1389(+)
MASELLGTLGARRSSVDKHGQTWESQPVESGADAVHLSGAKFGLTPSVADWLRQKAKEMPEEDVAGDMLADALLKVLDTRGPRPVHAPAVANSEELSSMKELAGRLVDLQQQLASQRDDIGAEREELARREQELREQERALQAEHERRRNLEESMKNYPVPVWLGDHQDGVMNVAVVGNSGVGKSLLINKLRRLKPGASKWAPTGVKETTMSPTMYTFPGIQRVRLWDLPGAGTVEFPHESYIRDMGLRHFDSVLIVTAGRFTSIEVMLREELQKHGVPFFMVRTKIDLDIWNNKLDNELEENVTLENIRAEQRSHGIDRLYLVSSREPTRYDMPQLVLDAFPGVSQHLDAQSFLFTAGPSNTWDESWSMPVVLSRNLANIQGHWQDGICEAFYLIDGHDVHVTLGTGQTTEITLTEEQDKIWWCAQWWVDSASVNKARESGELRWAPAEIKHKPLVWRWLA